MIYRQTANQLIGTIDNEGNYTDKTIHSIVPNENQKINMKCVLGIFNSKLLNYCYKASVEEEGRTFAQVKTIYIKRLPFVIPSEQVENQIVQLVDNLLNLNKELQKTKLETQRQQLQRAIEHAENKIDKLVYELYGLSEEEIKIVEEGS